MSFKDISLYLPKYLSEESKNALYSALKDFPDVHPDKFYTSQLVEKAVIFQGDGLKDFLFINLPNTSEIKYRDGIVLSNTCDISEENVKVFVPRIVYAPIISLEKYCGWLKNLGKSEDYIQSQVINIKQQSNTSIFYLPANWVIDDSIVFLDNLFNIQSDSIKTNQLKERRIFTLSGYGHYLFLFKLSFHFSRIQEKVDRDKGIVM